MKRNQRIEQFKQSLRGSISKATVDPPPKEDNLAMENEIELDSKLAQKTKPKHEQPEKTRERILKKFRSSTVNLNRTDTPPAASTINTEKKRTRKEPQTQRSINNITKVRFDYSYTSSSHSSSLTAQRKLITRNTRTTVLLR
jgi:hypothetical protein